MLFRVGKGPKESAATARSARYGPVPVRVALILRVPVGGGPKSAKGVPRARDQARSPTGECLQFGYCRFPRDPKDRGRQNT